MTQRDMEIDFLEAQEQIDQEWEEFLTEWMGERTQGTMNGEERPNIATPQTGS